MRRLDPIEASRKQNSPQQVSDGAHERPSLKRRRTSCSRMLVTNVLAARGGIARVRFFGQGNRDRRERPGRRCVDPNTVARNHAHSSAAVRPRAAIHASDCGPSSRTRKVKKLVREPNASTRGDQHFIDILSRPIRQVPRWIGSQVRACSLVRPVTSREQYSTWLGTPRVTQNATVPCSTWLLMLPRAHST